MTFWDQIVSPYFDTSFETSKWKKYSFWGKNEENGFIKLYDDKKPPYLQKIMSLAHLMGTLEFWAFK